MSLLCADFYICDKSTKNIPAELMRRPVGLSQSQNVITKVYGPISHQIFNFIRHFCFTTRALLNTCFVRVGLN